MVRQFAVLQVAIDKFSQLPTRDVSLVLSDGRTAHIPLEPNGSIILTPNGDGYQQIQDPCAAISNFVENYNETELYQSWRIFQDTTDGFKLHLFAFDGSPLPPMFQVSTTPQMLPTQKLRNTTAATTVASSRKRSLLRRNTNAGVSSTACLAVTGGAWVVSLLALAL